MDLGLGAVALVFGSLAGGLPMTAPDALVAGAASAAFVAALYVAERVRVLSAVDKNRPASLILAGGTFVLLGVGLALGRAVIPAPSATLLWGCGFGLCTYRGVFGFLYPVPKRRLQQARQWGTPPGPDEGPPK